jgi:hypothetical protein
LETLEYFEVAIRGTPGCSSSDQDGDRNSRWNLERPYLRKSGRTVANDLLHLRTRGRRIIWDGRRASCSGATAFPDHLIVSSLEICCLEVHKTSYIIWEQAGEAPDVFATSRMPDEHVWCWNVRSREQRVQRLCDVAERWCLTVELRFPKSAAVIGKGGCESADLSKDRFPCF